MKNTLISRAVVTTVATGSAVLLAAGIASAHVSVVAPGATQGGYSVLTFRVPTESDTASTTKLTVALPDLKSARTEPMPGWTAVVEKDPTSLVAKSVTWTAYPGVGIAPGQFQQFVLFPPARCRSRKRSSSRPCRRTATATSSTGIRKNLPTAASRTSPRRR